MYILLGTAACRGIISTCTKECSRTGQISDISRFLQLVFLGSKTQTSVETNLGLQYSEQISEDEKFKMEKPKTIRASFLPGEWVTLPMDFKDSYFHIPIHSQSRKYLRVHIQGQLYQFRAFSFGLPQHPWVS